MSINLSKRTVIVTYIKSKFTNDWTFSLLEKGGPIIVSSSIEEGKKQMDKALRFSFAVRNLQYFDDITIVKKAEFMRSNNSEQREVEYRELTTV